MWEDEGLSERPFERCIITPLFTDSRSLQHVRHLHDRWGVEIVFDSGGFFVQQGKVTYDELFPRLLDFYARNDWAAAYVLPDFVPTSRNTAAEVDERAGAFCTRLLLDARELLCGDHAQRRAAVLAVART